MTTKHLDPSQVVGFVIGRKSRPLHVNTWDILYDQTKILSKYTSNKIFPMSDFCHFSLVFWCYKKGGIVWACMGKKSISWLHRPITTVQTPKMSPVQDGSARIWDILASLLCSGKKWRHDVHLYILYVTVKIMIVTHVSMLIGTQLQC